MFLLEGVLKVASTPMQEDVLALLPTTTDILATMAAVHRSGELARALDLMASTLLESVTALRARAGDTVIVAASGSSGGTDGSDRGEDEGNEADSYE